MSDIKTRRTAPPGDGSLRPLGRLEAFGDGVFAIAITLLVLEIATPELRGGSLLRGLAHEWPSFLAYGISFFTIGTVWLSHNAITRSLRGVDDAFLRLNLLLLFFVAFLPYPTKLAAEFTRESGAERVAVVFYALTFMAISVVLRVLWFYAAEDRRLIREDIDHEQITSRNLSLTPVLGFYALAVLVGLLIPQLAVAVLVLAVAYQAIPSHTIYGTLRRRSAPTVRSAER